MKSETIFGVDISLITVSDLCFLVCCVECVWCVFVIGSMGEISLSLSHHFRCLSLCLSPSV